RDNILVTSGAQQGLFLLAQLLMGKDTSVGIESPGYPDARNNFELRTQKVHNLDVDDQGLVIDAKLNCCDYVFVTPRHQCPTTVTMSMHRRHQLLEQAKKNNCVVIEDDHESELNFSAQPMPALKSLDTEQRVVYIGSLS
ncbi:MAG: aminotransferase class I/II-fold pyridoxal phosphate-dependent enzyme, partial [Burkholderiales bacterium]